MSIQLPVFNFDGDSIYEYTRCSICNGQLNDPRQLPCLHTFCYDCLEDYTNIDYQNNEFVTDFSNNNSLFESILLKTSNFVNHSFGGAHSNNKNSRLLDFQCPTCHKKISIQPGGLPQLPRNIFLEKLIKVHDPSDKKEKHSNVVCQICKGINFCGGTKSDAFAVKFCSDCKQHLCHRCVEYHRLLNTTSSHKLLTIGSDEELVHRLDEVYCKTHSSEIIDIYCKICNTTTCRLCFSTSDHSGHSGCGILEASIELKELIQTETQDLSNELEYIKKSLHEIEEVTDRFNTNIENIENSVQNKEEELKVILMKHSEKLKKEIEEKKFSFNKELEKVKKSLEDQKIIVEEYSKYSQLLLYKATPDILVCSAKEILRRFKELRKTAFAELSYEVEPSFVPSKIATEVVLNRKMSICGGVPAGTIRNKIFSEGAIDDNLIGFLEFKTKYSKKRLASLTMTKQPVVMQTFTFNDYAICMALVEDDDEDYLCCATYSSGEIVIKEARNIENRKIG
ncbi:hypothetical protein HELRODRAFT_164963 [Helobdella robusta]|uniref:B box-type domain-containing protein n=1 Tax=Helobdella robusta TaxID=6412 RepID=T1EW08_HELRO|nr:hypothetical protein HELRODRAFT_164963 [Helobdella robusta]ESN92832.1 hypothetical protein HELRODRAFT_164963 [Helobdella robusta]